jgi:hypothetical protein
MVLPPVNVAYTDNAPCKVYIGNDPWGGAHPENKTLNLSIEDSLQQGFEIIDVSESLSKFDFTVADMLGDDKGGLRYEIELLNPGDDFERVILGRLGRALPELHSRPPTKKNTMFGSKSVLPVLYMQWGYGDPNSSVDETSQALSKVHTIVVTDLDYSLKSGKEKILKITAVDMMTYTMDAAKAVIPTPWLRWNVWSLSKVTLLK